MYKFYNDYLDNLFEFKNDSQNKFKEKNDLLNLINTRQLLFLIPFILKGDFLKLKFSNFTTLDDMLETMVNNDNKFQKWALKNNIKKIQFIISDQPDLIIINPFNNQKIGIELTSIFPFGQTKRGNILKKHKSDQTKISMELLHTLHKLNSNFKIPKFEINDGKIKFLDKFKDINNKEEVINTIKSINYIDKLNETTFDGNCLISDSFSEKIKLILNENDFERNLLNAIEIKNKKLKNYSTKNNTLLILVELIDNLFEWVHTIDKNHNLINYFKIKNECCNKHYFDRVELFAKAIEHNFDQIIILYKNSEHTKRIHIIKNK